MGQKFYTSSFQESVLILGEDFLRKLFSLDMLIEILLIGLISLSAYLFAKKSAHWTENRLKDRSYKTILRIYGSYREIFFLAYFILLNWIVVLTARGAGLQLGILHTLGSLCTAWVIIRLLSGVIQSPLWSKAISLFVWVCAALFILHLSEEVISILDRAAIKIGDFRLSLLIIVKSLFAFGVLFWVVRVISRLTRRVLGTSNNLNPSQKVLFGKISDIALYAFAILVGLNIAGLDLRVLTVFGGALGLGIGFGLQKIFSNLISGIILLLDKSIKPGDTITVGDSYGWVNSLSARHVSILTRDGKEHLIPNENLITNEVVNWSHSNPNVRIHIPVNVAYDSDIHKVRELLLQATSQHKRILKNPAPNCLIMGFGDNAIQHEIRAWIVDPEVGVSNVKSDIYYKIWELFQQNNIKIPFPQRDLHVKIEDKNTITGKFENGEQ